MLPTGLQQIVAGPQFICRQSEQPGKRRRDIEMAADTLYLVVEQVLGMVDE